MISQRQRTAHLSLALALAVGLAPANDGRLRVDPADPAHLARTDGAPLFVCGPGDPEGFLFRGSRNGDGTRDGDQDALIDKLAASGSNGIYIAAVRSHGGDGDSTENPFVDPSDPLSGLNERVLDQWSDWLERLDDQGVVIYLFLYDDSADPWITESWLARLWYRLTGGGGRMGSDEERFVRSIVDRFEGLENLVWVVAEEYDEALTRRRASQIAATIRDADDNRHPIAVHQRPGLIFHFADDPNVDEFAMQFGTGGTSPAALHNAVVRARQLAAGRHSVVMSEVPYGAVGQGDAARRKVWAMAMGGAWVLVNGWDIESTPAERLRECGYLARFMERAGASELASHDEIASAATSYVLASPPERYLAYASRPGEIGLRGLPPGTYDLTWLDAVTGEVVEQPGWREDRADSTWSSPSDIGVERALLLRRRD